MGTGRRLTSLGSRVYLGHLARPAGQAGWWHRGRPPLRLSPDVFRMALGGGLRPWINSADRMESR
jgi:hypothetical protein